jgi:sigma-B regulation protein RsbU (phosphoserine phosphatase)
MGGAMSNRQNIEKNPWLSLYKSTGRKLAFFEIGANMAGAGIVTCYFFFFDTSFLRQDPGISVSVIGIMCIGLICLATVVLRYFQKDLERFVKLKAANRQIDSQLQKKVQRIVLDFPFISAVMSFFNWLLAAIIMTLYIGLKLKTYSEGASTAIFFNISGTFLGVIIAGIVTSAIVYFAVEIVYRRLWPYFFPDGGMVKAPCTFRLKLPARMLVIFILSSILPIIMMAVLSYNKARMMLILNPEDVIQSLLYLTAFLLATALAVAVILSRLFSTSIIGPVSRMEDAMARVEAGDLTVNVPVQNNDELGALAEHFNRMTEGLKERYRLRRSLNLAREVQQNLLPKENPVIPGLDIAGRSIYCDETGGDYYDFIIAGGRESAQVGIAIGDVSGHGIASALLMATVRSSLRQRASLPGTTGNIISDINRQLVRDVEDSGQFVTMLYITIDPVNKHLNWVRAGHDPAIFYDPDSNSYQNLGGAGIALGVDENWVFEDNLKAGLAGGQIILLSTDGIWEARNPKGEMFGKEPVFRILKKYAPSTANEILEAILDALNRFRESAKLEDDITLVIIKIKN